MASNKKITTEEKMSYWKGQLEEMKSKRDKLLNLIEQMREMGLSTNEADEMNRDMKEDINEVRFYIKMLALEG